MAYRGRGRGRGYGIRPSYAKQLSVPIFPDCVELPDAKNVEGEKALLIWHGRMASYWKCSPYLEEDKSTEKKELADIETYVSRASKSKRKWTKESASAFMKLEPGYFPQDLLEGVKSRVNKKVKWSQNKDDLDIFDKYIKEEQQNKNNKEEKDGKESDDEDEEKEEGEDESDASSVGDYDQNEQFDDDEDDFNVDDDGGDDGDIY